MYVKIPSSSGIVGDKQKHNGLTYQKQSNGRWLIVRNSTLKRLLKRLHVDEGKTLREITKETGIPHSSVQKGLEDFGLMRSKKALRKDFDGFIAKNAPKVLRLYCDKGMRCSEICKLIKQKTGKEFTSSMLGGWLKRQGVKRSHAEGTALRTKPFKEFLEENEDWILCAYLKGHTPQDIFSSFENVTYNKKLFSSFLEARGYSLRTQAEALRIAADLGKIPGSTSKQVLQNKRAVEGWYNDLEKDLSSLTWIQYKELVKRFTYKVAKRYPKFFCSDMFTRNRQERQLDHRFAVFNGYHYYDEESEEFLPRPRPIALGIICHPLNCKVIPAKANRIKSRMNFISLEELKRSILCFENEYGNIFEDYYA